MAEESCINKVRVGIKVKSHGARLGEHAAKLANPRVVGFHL